MAKIVRYSGNLKAFASEAIGTERTVFGDITQSDTLNANIVADWLRGWGIVAANENPTKQDFNALGFTLSQLISYMHQMGIAEYDAAQEYHIGSLCNASGVAYSSKTNTNVGNTPASSPTHWELLNVTEFDARFAALAGLATQDFAARKLIQAAGANIASADTIDLSTATGSSPRITGTVATSAITMSTGQWSLVVADGAWPLTYNATTNKLNTGGASITLAAGDMVLYSKDLSGVVHGNIIKADGTAIGGADGLGYGQTWQNVTASRSKDELYTNTSGKPIMLNIVCGGGDGGLGTLTVSGVVVGSAYQLGNVSAVSHTLSAVVPNLGTYSYSGTNNIANWAELR